MAKPLIINEDVTKEIERVKKYANEHRINYYHTVLVFKDKAKSAGDYPDHCLEIPVGFRIVYSIEEQLHGWFHHFSASASDSGRTISVEGMRMIVDEFGLKGQDYAHVFLEELDRKRIAVNVLIKEIQ